MIEIINFNMSYLEKSCKLICNTYKEFNNNEGTPEAVEKYISYYNPDINSINILEKSFERTTYCYLAINKNNVVGIIRGVNGRIINLFVDKNYHNKGIASKLVSKFEIENLRNGVKIIKFRASLYAIGFYQKLGYKKTTGIRSFIGLKVQPMKKIL